MFEFIFIGFYGAFWVFALVALIFLAVKRYKSKDKETFEKRDS